MAKLVAQDKARVILVLHQLVSLCFQHEDSERVELDSGG